MIIIYDIVALEEWEHSRPSCRNFSNDSENTSFLEFDAVSGRAMPDKQDCLDICSICGVIFGLVQIVLTNVSRISSNWCWRLGGDFDGELYNFRYRYSNVPVSALFVGNKCRGNTKARCEFKADNAIRPKLPDRLLVSKVVSGGSIFRCGAIKLPLTSVDI